MWQIVTILILKQNKKLSLKCKPLNPHVLPIHHHILSLHLTAECPTNGVQIVSASSQPVPTYS